MSLKCIKSQEKKKEKIPESGSTSHPVKSMLPSGLNDFLSDLAIILLSSIS